MSSLSNIYINEEKYTSALKKDMTIIQLCSSLGIEIPRFCYHERLSIAGNCRMCLVEVEKAAKPVAACALPVAPNMVIYTNSLLVKKAREGILEFLLINHPLDCPICDQGGECDLQDQAMIFGGDRGRFYELKRAVEDKDCGPLIKTSMNRCIHCTRCVRFSTEIAGVSSLGTLGRGYKTEIGTYIKSFLSSEVSANIVDLCPVGALTLKPEAFNRRSWEIDSIDSIDIFDSIGSNIRIDFKNTNIVRILPRLNENINEEWITDKVRFAYDGLKKQRLLYPSMRYPGNFVTISWERAFNIIKVFFTENILQGGQFIGVLGNLASLNTANVFKQLPQFIGSSNYINETLGQLKINSDLLSDFLFNTRLKDIKYSDVGLLVGANPRLEAPILNIKLRLNFKNKILGVFGHNMNLGFPTQNLGSSLSIFKRILEGRHWFCNFLAKSKKPLIIFGSGFYLRPEFKNFNLVKTHLKQYVPSLTKFWSGYNTLFLSTGELNSLYNGYNSFEFKDNLNTPYFCYLVGVNNSIKFYDSLKKSFVIFQGHHGNKLATNSSILLPSFSFVETNENFLNCEGWNQKTKKILYSMMEARKDVDILKNLYRFLGFWPKFTSVDEIFVKYIINLKFNWAKLNFKNSLLDFNFKLCPKLLNFSTLERKKEWQNYFLTQTLKFNNVNLNSSLTNFYMTDNISRSSLNMALCVRRFNINYSNLKKKKL